MTANGLYTVFTPLELWVALHKTGLHLTARKVWSTAPRLSWGILIPNVNKLSDLTFSQAAYCSVTHRLALKSSLPFTPQTAFSCCSHWFGGCCPPSAVTSCLEMDSAQAGKWHRKKRTNHIKDFESSHKEWLVVHRTLKCGIMLNS